MIDDRQLDFTEDVQEAEYYQPGGLTPMSPPKKQRKRTQQSDEGTSKQA
jgi:hypothetical protein